MIQSTILLFLGLYSSFSFAAVINAPETTVVQQYRGVSAEGATPKTTQAPNALELRKRQEFATKTLIAAPDNTCGYFNGSSG